MASDTWNGTGDWSTSSDWSGGTPGAVTAAEVASGTADVSSTDDEDVSALTVDSGATVTVEGELTIGDSHLNMVPNDLAVAGSLQVDGGSLIVGGYVTSADGTVSLSNGGELLWNAGYEVGGTNATGLTVDMGANAGNTVFVFSEVFNGTIDNFNGGDQVGFSTSGAVTGFTTDTATNSVTIDSSAGNMTIAFGSMVNIADISLSGNTLFTSQPVCFASGTRIRTTRGEVAVEDLAVGDLAVTASGAARQIVWIGHKRTERPARAQWPVRVMAGAFGEGLPERDLRLSPGHAVCIDVMGEVFTPVEKLVNGATIVREEVVDVTYWHVELESHDVLLAEGLPCESYMDAGNRVFFGREYGRLEAIDPERVAESLTRYARPFVDRGPLVEAIRQRLAARSASIVAKVSAQAA